MTLLLSNRLQNLLAGLWFLACPAWVFADATQKTQFVKSHGEFQVSQDVPFFSLKQLSGRAIWSEEIQSGKKAHALVFFQTSCGPCVKGMQRLSAAQRRLQASGIRIVLVHVKEPKSNGQYWSDQDITAWLTKKGLRYDEVLFDRTGSLDAAGLYVEKHGSKTIQLPLTVLVSSTQKVMAIARFEGSDLADAIIKRSKR